MLKGEEERGDTSHLYFLIKGAEELEKAVCCGVFSEVSVCEVRGGPSVRFCSGIITLPHGSMANPHRQHSLRPRSSFDIRKW